MKMFFTSRDKQRAFKSANVKHVDQGKEAGKQRWAVVITKGGK